MYLDVSASSAAFSSSARRACSTSLFFRSNLDVLFGELLCLQRELLVRLLQFALSCLQLDGQLLRLQQEVFRPHGRFNRVEDNAD